METTDFLPSLFKTLTICIRGGKKRGLELPPALSLDLV